MMLPTGSAFLATSTLAPPGTAGAAAARCAPAPANMFLAMTAVTTAMTSAPTSRASFFTFMARSPPLSGLPDCPQTSAKLVKKPLGENCEAAKSNGDPIRNLRPAIPPFGAMPDEEGQGDNSARKRGQHEEFHDRDGRKPQGQRGRELDVT